MSTLKDIPLSQITVEEGHNPRATVEADPGLVVSIEQYGILSPLTVRENGSGYILVAGERRLTAAALAGLKEVPCIVKADVDPQAALAQALIENFHREDLNPVEEAHAIAKLRELGITSRKALVARTGLTERQVKDRETILALPDSLQKLVVEGKLTLNALGDVAEIAKQSPALAATLVEAADDLGIPMGEFRDCLRELYEQRKDRNIPGIWEFDGNQRRTYPLTEFDLGEELNDLVRRFNEVFKPNAVRLSLSDAALDAAAATGCLIEIPSEYGSPIMLITSKEWLTDRFKQHLEKKSVKAEFEEAIKKGPNAAKEEGDTESALPEGVVSRDTRSYEERQADLEQKRKSEQSEAREQWVKDKEQAEQFNPELAKQLFERVKVETIDKDLMAGIVALAIDHDGGDWAMRGLRYLHPSFVVQSTTKTGKPKTSYEDSANKAKQKLVEFLDAPTPEGIATKFLQLIVAAYAADEKVVARSSRKGSFPTGHLPKSPGKLQKLWQKGRTKLTPKLKEQADLNLKQASFALLASEDPFTDHFAGDKEYED